MNSASDRQPDSGLTSRERWAFLVLLLLVASAGLFDHSLWSANDSREGAMIADMARTGTWLTPVLNGEPYFEKPPLLHWTGVLLCRLFGCVNEGLVRLPAALYGVGALLLAWRFGWRLGRERAGMAAAFLGATAMLYFEYSHIVLTDAALTFMVMLSFDRFWTACISTRLRALPWAVFILVAALSFYAKGLLGPGFVGVTVVSYLLYCRKWLRGVALGLLMALAFVAVVAPWAWALYQAGGQDYLRAVFWDNQFGRFLTFTDPTLPRDPYFIHKQPAWFYLKALPISLLPWTLLVAAALVHWFRRGRGLGDPLSVFIRFAVCGMAVVLHVSAAKVRCYALPMFPFLFLMTAVWIEDAWTRGPSRGERWIMRLTVGLAGTLLILLPAAYLAACLLPASVFAKWSPGIHPLRAMGPAVVATSGTLCVLVIACAWPLCRYLRRQAQNAPGPRFYLQLPAVYATVLAVLVSVLFPMHDFQRTYRPFAELARREMDAGRKIALGFRQGRDTAEDFTGAFTFYLGRRLPALEVGPPVAAFLNPSNGPAAVMIRTRDLDKLLPLLPPGVRALKSDYPGYKVNYFRLLVNEPPPLATRQPASPNMPAGRKP